MKIVEHPVLKLCTFDDIQTISLKSKNPHYWALKKIQKES